MRSYKDNDDNNLINKKDSKNPSLKENSSVFVLPMPKSKMAEHLVDERNKNN